jgi:Ca2+-transporting ATPase
MKTGAPIPPETPWHALPAADALARLKSSAEGLDEGEARRRSAVYGPNLLRPLRPVSAWRIFGRQLRGVVPLLLAATALVSLLAGDLFESASVAAVLAVNLVLGFFTEWRALRAMHALRCLQTQLAIVRRAGQDHTIPASGLVPGDLMVLEAGAAVAADARVLAASELDAIEAPLTGEPFPVAKGPDPAALAAPLAERCSMVYKGTMVATGSGLAVVTAIGADTEAGRVSQLIDAIREVPAPLEQRLEKMGSGLVFATLAIAALVTAAGVWRGGELPAMLGAGLALAVAAVPEGLPVVATILLAVGLHRMARRRALVRRLPAVEALGSTTVLCTDKTGTLTAGEMTATSFWVAGNRVELSGRGYFEDGRFRLNGAALQPAAVPGLVEALEVGALANRARLHEAGGSPEGDPTELSLLVAARKAGIARGRLLASSPELAEVPFSSQRMLMATFHRQGDSVAACVKGAPGRLLERCSRWLDEGGPRPLDPATRARLLAENTALASQGLRVLALARRQLEPGESPGEEALRELEWLGMVGIEDPLVEGVEETVATLRAAGIRVVMLTGDQRATAAAIAGRLGIAGPGDLVIEGSELGPLSPGELAALLPRVAVLARLAPADKLRIVEAFQGRGEIVAMVGDGINDGPALRQADIGVAMGGRGTDVAKETAGVVLADDRLETIVAAVAEGRVIRDNVQKVLYYLFACNLAEVLVLGTGMLGGLPLPLSTLQILWLNLVTDVFPALGLAMEKAEPGLMRRPPKKASSQLVSRRLLRRILFAAAGLAAATLAAFGWVLAKGGEPSEARTTAFLTLGLAQLLFAFDASSPRPVIFGRRLFHNGWLWAAFGTSLALQLIVVLLPALARPFGSQLPSLAFVPAILAAALLPLGVAQLLRLARRQGH